MKANENESLVCLLIRCLPPGVDGKEELEDWSVCAIELGREVECCVVDSIEVDVSIAVDAINEVDGTAVDDGVEGILVE